MTIVKNPYSLTHCIYWPAFIPKDEAQIIFDKLDTTVEWRQREYPQWNTKMPRLTAFYGKGSYKYSGLSNTGLPFNDALIELNQYIQTKTGVNYNACLLNKYRDGNDSVAWHADDEKDLDPNTSILSLSFGSTRTFSIRPNPKYHNYSPITNIELNSGDLFIMLLGFQNKYLHAILKDKSTPRPKQGENQTRINATFRNTIS